MAKDHRTGKLTVRPERIELSERDSLCVLELLDSPPEPSARLSAAARLYRQIVGGPAATLPGQVVPWGQTRRV
jgi:hypothetical protein